MNMYLDEPVIDRAQLETAFFFPLNQQHLLQNSLCV